MPSYRVVDCNFLTQFSGSHIQCKSWLEDLHGIMSSITKLFLYTKEIIMYYASVETFADHAGLYYDEALQLINLANQVYNADNPDK